MAGWRGYGATDALLGTGEWPEHGGCPPETWQGVFCPYSPLRDNQTVAGCKHCPRGGNKGQGWASAMHTAPHRGRLVWGFLGWGRAGSWALRCSGSLPSLTFGDVCAEG